MSKVHSLSHGDISSVESKKEKKVEDKLDKEGNVIKKGREAATWTVSDLVKKANSTIQKQSAALSEISQTFNDRLKSAIVTYIKSSPGRFESDLFKGLSNTEYNNFSASMHSMVMKTVNDYAPTKEAIAAKRKAESAKKSLQASSKEVAEINLDDIEDNPGEMNDLKSLGTNFGKFSGWNAGLQKQGARVMKYGAKFQKTFQDFRQARAGMKVWKKLGDYVTSDDQLKDVNAVQVAAKSQLDSAIEKFEKGKKKLDAYGQKMSAASNAQKQKQIQDRDKHLKRIETDETLSKEQKVAKQAKYAQLKNQRDTLGNQKKELDNYVEGLKSVRETKVKDKIVYAEGRQNQLNYFNNVLTTSTQKIQKLLDDPKIPEDQKKELKKTQEKLSKKSDGVAIAQIGVDAVLQDSQEKWDTLSKEEQTASANSYKIETHLTEDVIPTIGILSHHIGMLDSAMIQYTTSKTEVISHYDKVFKTYDEVNTSVNSTILSQNLANAQMLGAMKAQSKTIGTMSLASTTLWQASVGLPFSIAGGAISYVAQEILSDAAFVDRHLDNERESMGEAKYWAAKIGLEILSTPMGAVAGALEIVAGLGTMIGDPAAAASGIGALIGRDPNTGEWSLSTAGHTWKEMGKAIISYEHFEKGQIGVGIGKIFTNIVTTITGAGAVGAGGKAAGKAAQVAARATVKAAGKAAVAQGRLLGLTGKALGQYVKAAMKGVKWQARAAGLKAGTTAFGKAAAKHVGDEVVVGAKNVAAAPGRLVGAAKAAPKAARAAAKSAWETGARGMMRGLRDNIASRNRLTKYLFGEEAAIKGLSKRNKKLLSEIQDGAEHLTEFNKRAAKLNKKHPKLTDAEIRLKVRREDPVFFEKVTKLEKKIDQTMHLRARFEGDYHLDIDGMSGMRKKQMLYTEEGMRFLEKKFGSEVNMTFGDVTGMGIGNKYLHGPGEGIAEAMITVDDSFKMMKEVADEVFKGKPIEVVRFGGDEIVFLTKKGDSALMDKFFKRFNERKKEYLIEKIGEPAYKKARYETNVKAQQKLIDRDLSYHKALNEGEGAMREWYSKRLNTDEMARSPDLADLNRTLAEKKLRKIPKNKRFEPLDFYRAPDKTIALKGRKAHKKFMKQIAEADSDIAWQKAHPGQKPPKNRKYGEDVKKSTGDYLNEAKGVQENAVKIKELQGQLAIAEKLGETAQSASLRREITVLNAKDPGTGAIRLNNGKHHALEDLMPIPKGTKEMHVMKVDVNYFGSYNNNYWMAKADQMMTELKVVVQEAYGAKVVVVRDGGKFFFISKKTLKGPKFKKLQANLNKAIKPYAEGLGSVERRGALRLEMERKMRASGSKEVPGTVQLFESHAVKLDEGATLLETIGRYDDALEARAATKKAKSPKKLKSNTEEASSLAKNPDLLNKKFKQLAENEDILAKLKNLEKEMYGEGKWSKLSSKEKFSKIEKILDEFDGDIVKMEKNNKFINGLIDEINASSKTIPDKVIKKLTEQFKNRLKNSNIDNLTGTVNRLRNNHMRNVVKNNPGKHLDELGKYNPKLAKKYRNIDFAYPGRDLEDFINDLQNYRKLKKNINTAKNLFDDLNPNIEKLKKYCKTPEETIFLDFLQGKIDDISFLKGMDESVLANLDKLGSTKQFQAIEKVHIVLKIDKQIAKLKSSNLPKKELQAKLRQFEECKEMLAEGKFGTDLHHGTSSLIWDGLESSNGKMLSSAELKRRGIISRTGEKDVGGGLAEKDEISAGAGPDGLGTARTYAEMNVNPEGYRSPIYLNEVTIIKRIKIYKSAIAKLEDLGMGETGYLSTGVSRKAFARKLAEYEEVLRIKTKAPHLIKAEPYPIIFGLKNGKLKRTPVARGYGDILSGEVNINEPVVSLSENLNKVYVPAKNIPDARLHLQKMLGNERTSKVKIYSIESLDLMASLRGKNNVYSQVYKKSYKHLDAQTRETLKMAKELAKDKK